ncbi:MAG: class I SAM-dependent methyltransferase [Spirochaetota bacterium]
MRTTLKPDGSLLAGRRLDLGLLRRLSERPEPYSGRDKSFWTDPYVAGHVLEAHLDPATDDASRRPAHIGKTVETVLSHYRRSAVSATSEPRLLDLACGPGLYAEQFAARGFAVTAIDFSSVSIGHAKKQARKQGLAIDYRCEDFTKASLEGPYQIATVIYGEFCTLSEDERALLLRRLRENLAPGGLLVLDVFTEAYDQRHRSCDEWYVSTKDGFWQADSHLVLLQHFHYDAEAASVARYTIVDEKGSYRQFSVWWRHYDEAGIVALLEREGFAVEQLYGSLWGDPIDPQGEWIGVYARPAT